MSLPIDFLLRDGAIDATGMIFDSARRRIISLVILTRREITQRHFICRSARTLFLSIKGYDTYIPAP